MKNPALEALRHHVTGAIERGEGVAIIGVTERDALRAEMKTMQAPSQRIIRAAAALDTRYSNPTVVAMRRANRLNQRPAVRVFWLKVVSALFRPYSCQSWTDYDSMVWDAIRAEQSRVA